MCELSHGAHNKMVGQKDFLEIPRFGEKIEITENVFPGSIMSYLNP